MNKIEILAPCGGLDSVYAAVRSGADAIYIGAKSFSARASAKNFDIDDLSTAVSYCHTHSVKMYLALNTLIFDDELESALSLVKKCAQIGIDAVIVQDIGLAMAIKRVVPTLRLHASTQMSVHTLSGAKALYELGFSRVVLARELTLSEIKHIADNCDIELEVFVHGALCMSVSGQCLMSSVLGTRSANRGMCAQPCRLEFAIGDTTHALSLKDNSVIKYLRELEKIGVKSAKIEGRMKRPEYVAAATSACVQYRDTGFVDDNTKKYVDSVFSRTGFTDGYLADNRTGDMFGYRTREDVVQSTDKLLREIRTTYKDEVQNVAVNLSINIQVNKPIELCATDGTNTVRVLSDNIVEKAQKNGIDKDRVTANLSKTGDTPYKVQKVQINADEDAFVRISDINTLRRKALCKLDKLRANAVIHKINDIDIEQLLCESYEHKALSMKKRARVRDLEIPKSFLDFELVFAPLFEVAKNKEKAKNLVKKGFNLGVEIPRGMFSLDEKIQKALEELRAIGITDVLCNNIGAVYLAKQSAMTIHLGCFMNIANSLSLMWARDYGCKDATLSVELNVDRLHAIRPYIPTGVVGYGYLPLMLTRNCPKKAGGITCASCKSDEYLQDRMGERFRVICDTTTSEILNCVPLILPSKIYNLKNLDFTIFHFTVENSVENKEKIIKKISKNQKFERFTHGLYIRGVKKLTIF